MTVSQITYLIDSGILEDGFLDETKPSQVKKNLELPYPEEVMELLEYDYSVLDSAHGDLNKDGISDVLLVLKRNEEETISDVTEIPSLRPLFILIGDENSNLTSSRRNDRSVLCVDCGGAMGDPFVDLVIKDGYFSVEHYGGSAWRWNHIVTYKYSKEEDEWYLYQDGGAYFNVNDLENIDGIKTKIKTVDDFGKVKFEDYDIYEEE